MKKTEICKRIIRSITSYIDSPDCLEAHRSHNHFIRKRKLSFKQVVMYLLYSSKASMFQNLATIFDDLGEDAFPLVSKQAVSKARGGIRPSLFHELFNLSVDIFYKNIGKRKTWHGMHVFAIDAEWLFRFCTDNGHPCVMRLREQFKITKASHGDITTILAGNPKAHTEDMKIRVIAVPLESGETEYLATNIFDKSITADMFKELYFLRWPIESKYYELKYRVNIEEFNGATSNSIRQEFFINMLISNLASLIKNAADGEIDSRANPGNRYRYQANRTFIIGRLKRLFPKVLFGLCDVSVIDKIFNEALTRKSQIQPGRKRQRRRIDGRRKHFRNSKTSERIFKACWQECQRRREK